MEHWQGRTAILTGAGRGIGRAAALALGAVGVNVVIADSSAGSAESVVEEISSVGGRATAIEVDVTSRAAVEASVDTATRTYGAVDILCTFAGNYIPKAFDETSDEELRLMLDIHIAGTAAMVRAVYPVMRARGYGRIVTVGSRGAFPHPDDSAGIPADQRSAISAGYSAAKAGVMGYTAALAADLNGRDEDVTAVCLLPSAQTQLFPGGTPRKVAGIPGAVNLEADALSPLIMFLASSSARELSGAFVYGGGNDIAILPAPIRATEGTRFFHKSGESWKVDELTDLLATRP